MKTSSKRNGVLAPNDCAHLIHTVGGILIFFAIKGRMQNFITLGQLFKVCPPKYSEV
jgi:hypothetical protein